MTSILTPERTETARKIAEWFVPQVDGYPTTAEADPDNSVLNLVLDQLQSHWTVIGEALDAAQDADVPEYLERLAAEEPATYGILRTVFVGRYLTCRPVWEVLGYTGRRPVPILPGEAEKFLEGGLLEPVRSRGKIYRPTPTDAEVAS
ncbi:hypothetical protein PUN71_021785 [Arthrobacter sp. NQ7]|uniref:hypothetical protein n=1 Tax=Arthrobacter sp. NQ7 TaxID=3032303 RepID=UPI00240EA3A1|nr:hypothetical protein [Arthrobacter sp. NQ7]MDJ0459844.1 hypothetical protein [Arthrobacter sp. NQ7]